MITHLEPDILECKIKWPLGSITMNRANGCDGIPVELFQILKYDAVKVLHSICQQIWKMQQWPQDWKKVSFHSNPKERQWERMFKLPHNCTHLTRLQVMLKILPAWLPQYMKCELPAVQAGYRKGIGTRDQIANICWITHCVHKSNLYVSFWSCPANRFIGTTFLDSICVCSYRIFFSF